MIDDAEDCLRLAIGPQRVGDEEPLEDWMTGWVLLPEAHDHAVARMTDRERGLVAATGMREVIRAMPAPPPPEAWPEVLALFEYARLRCERATPRLRTCTVIHAQYLRINALVAAAVNKGGAGAVSAAGRGEGGPHGGHARGVRSPLPAPGTGSDRASRVVPPRRGAAWAHEPPPPEP